MHLVAKGLGEIVGAHQTNVDAKLPRFCVTMDVE